MPRDILKTLRDEHYLLLDLFAEAQDHPPIESVGEVVAGTLLQTV